MTDPAQYTFIAHRNLPFANPLGESTWETLLRRLDLSSSDSCIDFGAGTCELAIRLAERYKVRVIAVELSPLMAATARQRIKSRLLDHQAAGGVTVHEGDAGTFRAAIPAHSFDLTVCVGSTHALGGTETALAHMARLIKRNGLVLLGEGYWKKPPSTTFLEATGISESEFVSFEELVYRGIKLGLEPIWTVTATQREFDEYEWEHQRALDQFAIDHPGDPDARNFQARGQRWRRAYIQGGREALGFGLVLFRSRPAGEVRVLGDASSR